MKSSGTNKLITPSYPACLSQVFGKTFYTSSLSSILWNEGHKCDTKNNFKNSMQYKLYRNIRKDSSKYLRKTTETKSTPGNGLHVLRPS